MGIQEVLKTGGSLVDGGWYVPDWVGLGWSVLPTFFFNLVYFVMFTYSRQLRVKATY